MWRGNAVAMAKGAGEVLCRIGVSFILFPVINSFFNLIAVEHKALGCPYFVDMEESVSMKVLLSPGEARLRILHWLVER